MNQNENTAYDKLYLRDVMEVHRYLFTLMERNKDYDTFSMIDSFMRYSPIRRRMDEGNWSALNKSGKQLYNDVPLEHCLKNQGTKEYDDILLGWMADIYVLMQWRYNIPSAQLSEAIPASEMCKAFHPLYETSYNNACIKLHHKYLE